MEILIERLSVMQNKIILIIFLAIIGILFICHEASAACSSPVSRTNNAANSVLTSSKYNTDLNAVYTAANTVDGSCLTDDTVTSAKLDATTLGPQLNAIQHGFKCSRSDANTIAISRGWITVNSNSITTTTDTTIQFGCGGCSAEATGTAYYVALKTGTVEDPVITTTAPDDKGYSGTSNYICKFWNDGDSNIATNSISQWAVNRFVPDFTHIKIHTKVNHGSTNTMIPYFSKVDEERTFGDGLTYASSVVNGDSFTVNTNGMMTVRYALGDGSAGACAMGVSINSAQLTTEVISITKEDLGGAWSYNITGSAIAEVSSTFPVISGDVVRPHTRGNTNCDHNIDQTFLKAILVPVE